MTPNHINFIESPASDIAAQTAAKTFYGRVFSWQYRYPQKNHTEVVSYFIE